MKIASSLLLALLCTLMFGCNKKAPDAPSSANTAATASVTASSPNNANQEPTEAQREMAQKRALMDYATMEDQFINDPHGQWASSVKASSTFGDDNNASPSSSNSADNVKGGPDGNTWTNNHQDMGFDTVEVSYAKEVSATQVRIVFQNGEGVEAVSKIELQDSAGKWNTVWSGISEQKRDERGPRTWFVRNFDKPAFKTKAVKITIANNVQRGYKVIDALQLVGE